MKSTPFSLQSIAVTIKLGKIDKRPFVFLHGNSQNSCCGQAVLEFFSQRGHSVLSYDLPGHGNSPLDTEDYVFNDLIDLNQQILKQYEIKNPILCGHSLGGMIHAGSVAKYQIKDASLIFLGSLDANPSFVGPKYLSQEKAEELSKALDAYMKEGFRLFKRQYQYDYFENRHVEDEIVNIINRRYNSPQASFINLNTLGEFDVRPTLLKMKIPIVVMHGLKEQVIHPDLIKAMVEEYEDIQLCWYPENGHLAFYQQPELTNQFLKEHYDYVNG